MEGRNEMKEWRRTEESNGRKDKEMARKEGGREKKILKKKIL